MCSVAFIEEHKECSWTSSATCVQRSYFEIITMMTSSNGNIFRVTGPLCGEFTGPGEFPAQRPVTRTFDVFFDLRLNKRLSKQPCGWWFETPSWSLWRQCNDHISYGKWVDTFHIVYDGTIADPNIFIWGGWYHSKWGFNHDDNLPSRIKPRFIPWWSISSANIQHQWNMFSFVFCFDLVPVEFTHISKGYLADNMLIIWILIMYAYHNYISWYDVQEIYCWNHILPH